MEKLESMIEITEKDLEESRKDFRKIGTFLHFTGETIGLVYYTAFKGFILPTIQNMLEHNDGFEIDYKSAAIGLSIYVATQIPAVLLKGLSMTKEENTRFAQNLEKKSMESKEKGLLISSFLGGKMSAFHHHFARNSDEYTKLIQRYTTTKNKLARSLYFK